MHFQKIHAQTALIAAGSSDNHGHLVGIHILQQEARALLIRPPPERVTRHLQLLWHRTKLHSHHLLPVLLRLLHHLPNENLQLRLLGVRNFQLKNSKKMFF